MLLKSMTGFGRCEAVNEECKITVEMKSVNHRYLDLSIKMPKKFNVYEAGIRMILKEYIQRGKVDIFVSYEDYTQERVCLKYNEALAKEYMDIFARMHNQFGIANDISVSGLSRFPEVITMEQAEEDQESLYKLLEEAVRGAAANFVETRLKEGEQLKADLCAKLDAMLEWVNYIEERSPRILSEYRMRLEDKVKELLGDSSIEESRIASEVILYADKICVDEETVRLRSHIVSMKDALTAGGGIGRKLDFIAQEMNREANTILSKANDLEISSKAIELKTEIEKVREQIQNIE